MKKRLLATVMAAGVVLSMTACGSSQTQATTAETTKAAASSEAAATKGSEAAGTEAAASTWKPTTTVSIVVPAGAGGNTDLSARVFAEYAKRMTGADFIVVNANGAAGSVAANQVRSAAADGHTFLYGHNLVNVANIAGVTDYNYTAFKLGPTFALDPAQQFYANPDKYKTLDEFIQAAKANPGKLKACTEVGAYTYYELLAFEKVAGIDLDLVDVGSNSDKIAAMLSGQVDLMPGAYINCKDYLEAKQFVCLGAPTKERYELIKDIPTLTEQGVDLVYPNCEFSFYFPKDTSDDVIAWYDQLVKKMTEDPEVKEAIAKVEMMPYYLSSSDSEANDEKIYNEIKQIADDLAK
ncbi:tripartite-type tricarboxylate transporter receptor subunit TctC [Lacrimispora xylanisolvens]|uniref:Tripartite-type tricarboxylate transporter receptor subunit TctC n=1 Tax=Lacrimispora xylanisolvens TaxID=384636 RepID=A0A2S6HUS2_9FIRM|nr:tripartite tricarboxylate transporter substrate binding protein [Hungatella xylanolytica]PPK81502.1 tripartite-type tricarboxylate transporter receptor subunit TctC [Hungatella xylanolytica]